MSDGDERHGAEVLDGFDGRIGFAVNEEGEVDPIVDPDERAVYVISVAAELAGMHPQTLRIYERKGLVRPRRTAGNSRRYSQRDVVRLRTIQDLTQGEGVNLAGVKMIMQMQSRLEQMQRRAEQLEQLLLDAVRRAEHRDDPGEIVLLSSILPLPWEDMRE